MAEADIDTIIALADGASGYASAMRGAMTTLQTRRTQAQAQADALTIINSYRPFGTQAHTASGALAWNWGSSGGNYRRITSAGFNITGITETNGPTGATMREAVMEIVNTHGSTTITVDLTSLGFESAFTIAAGASQIVWLISTPAL